MKGYALVEYATQREARAAVEGGRGGKLLGVGVGVDFAFVRPVGGGGKGGGRKGGRERGRSGSPEEK